MYTYGYIVDSTLAKLDMSKELAQKNGLYNKFSYYANEAMSQICSAIKPKRTFAKFTVVDRKVIISNLRRDYPKVNFSFLEYSWQKMKDATEWEQQCWKEYHSLTFLCEPAKMPEDFISFGDEINKRTFVNSVDERVAVNCTDDDFEIHGSNSILFKNPGIYLISYNARWFKFTTNTDYDEEIDAPDDVIECIPSYITSQCFKIDDETKAQVYRNEYEQFLSRIDDDHYISSKTVNITGDW